MNAEETTRICRAIAGIKPAQYFDDETPALWAVILADVRYEDARQAVITLGGTARFIDPSDIKAEVRRIRDERLKHSDLVMADTPEEKRAIIKAIADGEIPGPQPDRQPAEFDPRLQAALPAVFRRPPRLLDIARDGGPRPAKAAPAPTVPEATAEHLEDERRRQLDALATLTEETA